jgi:hypothetical protein
MNTSIVDLTGSYRRRILSIDEFNFRRTGFSGYFIFDAYAPLISIVACYILLFICNTLGKRI